MDDFCSEDQGLGTYQTYDLRTVEDGSIVGTTTTNDNGDTGFPGEYATWEVKYRNYADMQRLTGLSHVGCIGCVVTVCLDGSRV
jgi:hypothetical protein